MIKQFKTNSNMPGNFKKIVVETGQKVLERDFINNGKKNITNNSKIDWNDMKAFGLEVGDLDTWKWLCKQEKFMNYVLENNVSGCREIARRMLVIK